MNGAPRRQKPLPKGLCALMPGVCATSENCLSASGKEKKDRHKGPNTFLRVRAPALSKAGPLRPARHSEKLGLTGLWPEHVGHFSQRPGQVKSVGDFTLGRPPEGQPHRPVWLHRVSPGPSPCLQDSALHCRPETEFINPIVQIGKGRLGSQSCPVAALEQLGLLRHLTASWVMAGWGWGSPGHAHMS